MTDTSSSAAQPQSPRTIAIFDFDKTLIDGDSFLPFMGYVAGWPQTIAAMAEAFVLLGVCRLARRKDPACADPRTFVKAHLLWRLLDGRPVHSVADAAERLRLWRRWNEPIRAKLLEHHEKGHHVVIASGGLDLYLPALLKDLPHHAVICTTIGVRDNDITGEMMDGNAVRKRKAELVADYLEKHGPFEDSYGYGNAPHDLPMLDLLKNRTVV